MLCAALLGATWLVGCSNTRSAHVWTDQALAAEGLQDEGALEAAEAEYERLVERAPDAERRRWLRYNLAELAESRGEVEVALERYRALYEEPVLDRFGARATLRSGALVAERDGAEAALVLWRQAVERYPDEVAAEQALERLVSHHQSAGRHDEVVAELTRLHEAVEGSYVADNVLLRLARYHDEVRGDADAALATYHQLYVTYPEGPLADDALWEMAAIYRRFQHWGPAIALLERLTTDLESSWFIGNYNSEWVDDGIYDLGLIHLLYLDDYEAAVAHFERYAEDFPHSLLADDAGWHIVEARRLQGDRTRHLNALKRFVARFPESRWADTARARLGTPTSGGSAADPRVRSGGRR